MPTVSITSLKMAATTTLMTAAVYSHELNAEVDFSSPQQNLLHGEVVEEQHLHYYHLLEKKVPPGGMKYVVKKSSTAGGVEERRKATRRTTLLAEGRDDFGDGRGNKYLYHEDAGAETKHYPLKGDRLWKAWYTSLLIYKVTHGHCNVPRSFNIVSSRPRDVLVSGPIAPPPSSSDDHDVQDDFPRMLEEIISSAEEVGGGLQEEHHSVVGGHSQQVLPTSILIGAPSLLLAVTIATASLKVPIVVDLILPLEFEGRWLGRWLQTQREKHRSGTLRKDREQSLQVLVSKGELSWYEGKTGRALCHVFIAEERRRASMLDQVPAVVPPPQAAHGSGLHPPSSSIPRRHFPPTTAGRLEAMVNLYPESLSTEPPQPRVAIFRRNELLVSAASSGGVFSSSSPLSPSLSPSAALSASHCSYFEPGCRSSILPRLTPPFLADAAPFPLLLGAGHGWHSSTKATSRAMMIPPEAASRMQHPFYLIGSSVDRGQEGGEIRKDIAGADAANTLLAMAAAPPLSLHYKPLYALGRVVNTLSDHCLNQDYHQYRQYQHHDTMLSSVKGHQHQLQKRPHHCVRDIEAQEIFYTHSSGGASSQLRLPPHNPTEEMVRGLKRACHYAPQAQAREYRPLPPAASSSLFPLAPPPSLRTSPMNSDGDKDKEEGADFEEEDCDEEQAEGLTGDFGRHHHSPSSLFIGHNGLNEDEKLLLIAPITGAADEDEGEGEGDGEGANDFFAAVYHNAAYPYGGAGFRSYIPHHSPTSTSTSSMFNLPLCVSSGASRSLLDAEDIYYLGPL